MSAPELLPDSRTRSGVGAVPWRAVGYGVPIYCANCGVEGGVVPAENMTFAFWLCTPCAETHGEIAGTLMMPDEVFWKRVQDAQIEEYGRVLTTEEIAAIAEAGDSPLARLIENR